MTDLPTPVATRLRRPSWRDTRLIVGLLIVLTSVALGARVVAAADDTVPVYAASTTLVSGNALTSDDLTVVRVHLGAGAASYLRAQDPLPSGATVLRTVGAGELVPESAIGAAAALQVRPVTIPLEGVVPAGLRAGALADVWSSARDLATGAAAYKTPVRLARAAEVSAVTTQDGSLSVATGGSVQILLGEAELPMVLDALANGARVVLIPVPGAAGSSSG